ncbi:MAG: hypothetical protein IKZ88_06255 [Neisseriaceae bacterium]|nr:hypothetical protein [Neisseriaceae bacterium]
MKKVIISLLLGVLFGGVAVGFSVNGHQFFNIAQAKELPKNTPKNEVTTVENKQTDNVNDNYICNPNDILEKNISFSFTNNGNVYTVFDIKKRTNAELEFKLTYKNEKLNSPFILTGVAKAGFSNDDNDKTNYCEMDAEPTTIVSDETIIDTNSDSSNSFITTYNYYDDKNNCSFLIKRTEGVGNELAIENISHCKKLEEIGFNEISISIAEYE